MRRAGQPVVEVGPARDEPDDEALTARTDPPVSALFDADVYGEEQK